MLQGGHQKKFSVKCTTVHKEVVNDNKNDNNMFRKTMKVNVTKCYIV